MTSMVYAPATVLSSLINFVLRSIKSIHSNERNDDNTQKIKKQNHGLLGLFFHFISNISCVIVSFFANHKKVIAFSFWSSLFLGGIAALTVFFWPAALTAIAAFPICGFSIAGVVGTDLFLQVATVGILAFISMSVVTCFAAAIGACFKKDSRIDDQHNKTQITPKNTPINTAKQLTENTSPVHTPSLFKKQQSSKDSFEPETGFTSNP